MKGYKVLQFVPRVTVKKTEVYSSNTHFQRKFSRHRVSSSEEIKVVALTKDLLDYRGVRILLGSFVSVGIFNITLKESRRFVQSNNFKSLFETDRSFKSLDRGWIERSV